jgi:RHS repeat-associated protein
VQEYTGNVNGPVLWNLNLLDAQGNAISETYGNGLWLQNGYDATTGEPLTRQAGTGGQASNVQNLSYAWDDAGNLSSRQDLRQSLTESFSYDALDRLTLASGPATQSTAIGYDAIGNLTSKSGVGSYTYHSTKKHAVASAGGAAYTYDANGNLVSRGGATVSWTSDNLPASINDPSGYSAQFSYAPDRSRWRQVSSYAGGSETTIYVGGLLEKLTTATRTHWKHLIATPSGQVQVMRRSDGTTDTFYVTTDHLGSTDAVLNAAGAVLMRGSFTLHGARRASNWQGAPSTTEWQSIANTTRRGYTGHEQIDNVLLVHMNGRVFDPNIGRFLSADPYIDGPETTQGWNRYAYVHGRLMSATDPSGFEVEEVVVEGRRLYPTIGNYFIRLMLPTISRDYYSRGDSHGGGGGRSTSPPPQREDPSSDKCRIVGAVADSVGGAAAGATFAFLSGQGALAIHYALGGAVAGVFVSYAAPTGGMGAFVVATHIGAVTAARGGSSGGSFAEVLGAGVQAATPAGAMTIPMGTGAGAITAALRPMLQLGRMSSAIVGGHAGGMAAVVALTTSESISAVAGCP